MVRLQSKSFGECGVLLHCCYSRVHFDLEWSSSSSCRIFLTLSRHPSLLSIASGRSSGIHPVMYLLYVGSCWLSCFCLSMWRGQQEYITYEFVLTSSAVSHMSGSSNFDSFRDGGYVAAQMLLCGVLPPGLVQYCSQHSCVVAVKLFLHTFS